MSWKRRTTKAPAIRLEEPTHNIFKVEHNDEHNEECPLFIDQDTFTSSDKLDPSPPNSNSPSILSTPVCITGHNDQRIFDCNFAPQGHDVSRLWASFSTPDEVDDTETSTGSSNKADQHTKGETGEASRDSTSVDGNNSDQKWIATCGQDGTCRLWCMEHENGANEQISECYVLPCSTGSECLRMSWGEGLTRQLVATSTADGTIMLWNALEEQMVKCLPCVPSGVDAKEKPQVYACNLLGGQSTLIMGGYDDRVVFWDIPTGEPVAEWQFASGGSSSSSVGTRFGNECFVYGATVGGIGGSAGGISGAVQTFVAVSLSDGTVSIVDPRQATSQVSAYRWKAHDRAASDCAMSTGAGWKMASCSADGLVKVWDLRNVTSGPLCSLAGHTSPVFGVDFWSDNQVVSWANDGSLRQWDLSGQTSSVVLHNDVSYNLHGCSRDGGYVATCGGPTGTDHLPAFWKMHKIVSPSAGSLFMKES